MKHSNALRAMCALSAAVMLASANIACGSKISSFSLLPDENRFQQNSSASNGKIDILWVIDNSGSMETSQQNVANNFQRFIEAFNAKGFDYRIAVTTTDAYKVMFGASPNMAKFRDGTDYTSHTGVFVIEPNTPNLMNTFMTNIQQGIYGSGDERAFSSMRETLKSSLNAGFPRSDAFLSVIVVSDEDDFSHGKSNSLDGQYSNKDLDTVDSYMEFLDLLTGASPDTRTSRYNVNTIAILDEACRAELATQFTGRKIGSRYIQLTDKTSGIKGSLCGDFGDTLSNISSKIIELTTQFYLNRKPNPSTIVVTVDGRNIPQLSKNDPQPWNGFLYHPDSNSITFHGDAVPGPGSSIGVRFDPMTLK